MGASGSGGLVQRGEGWQVHVAQSEEEKACASVSRHGVRAVWRGIKQGVPGLVRGQVRGSVRPAVGDGAVVCIEGG